MVLGKSTTLRMLTTLVVPDAGSASIDGHDVVTEVEAARRNLGYMPHDAGIYPRLTARENIHYYARLCGLSAMDVMATRGLREIVRNLADRGHCIVFSSHVMQEVSALCDRIAIIAEGRIAMADTLPAILTRTGQTDLEDAFVSVLRLQPEEEA